MIRVTVSQFKVKYSGEDSSYHDLNAALLAQALLGFSDLGRAAYRVLHPEETHSLEIKIKAVQPGSFEIVLDAVLPTLESLYGQFVGIFNRPDSVAASNAGGIVGLIVTTFQFTLWLKGRPYRAETVGDQTVIVTPDGDTTTIDKTVYNFYGDTTFIQSAGQTLEPLDDPNYDALEFQDRKGNTLAKIHENDRGYFQSDPDTQESDETIKLEVTIETLQVDAATNKKWTLRSGNQKFNARMEDIEFAQQVSNGDIRISSATKLLVDRRTITKKQSNGTVKTEHYILKVHQVSNPGEQPTLFDI